MEGSYSRTPVFDSEVEWVKFRSCELQTFIVFQGNQGMKIFRFGVVFLLSLLSSLAHAEGTMIATVLQADFSKDPEIRLLVRVVLLHDAFC